MRLSEVGKPGDGSVRQLERGRVQRISAFDFYDGMLAGLADLDGERVWFCLAEEAADIVTSPWYRRFWLVRLSPEQLGRMEECDRDFKQCVADDTGSTLTTRPLADQHKFYDKWPLAASNPGDLSQSEVLGWFEESLGLGVQ